MEAMEEQHVQHFQRQYPGCAGNRRAATAVRVTDCHGEPPIG